MLAFYCRHHGVSQLTNFSNCPGASRSRRVGISKCVLIPQSPKRNQGGWRTDTSPDRTGLRARRASRPTRLAIFITHSQHHDDGPLGDANSCKALASLRSRVSKPSVNHPQNRSQQFARLLHLALVAPEACEAHCGAEFPGLCLMFVTRNPDATRRQNHEFLKSI